MNQNFDHMPRREPDAVQAGNRFDYLDNIKWSLAVLVILHHAAAVAGLDPFVINFPLVVESQRYQYSILSTFQSINQGFFMSLFFFISAYFVAPSYDKKGAAKFLRGRLIRLGIPVLLTVTLIIPIAFYMTRDFPLRASMLKVMAMYADLLRTYNMQLGVTWFCWTLIVFNAFFVLCGVRGLSGREAKQNQAPLPSMAQMIIFSVAMIPLNFLGQYLMGVLGKNFLGFHLLMFFPMYIAMFYLGIKAQKNNWIEQLTFKHVFLWILIYLIARIFLNPFSGMLSRPFEVIGMSIIVLYGFRYLYNFTNTWTKRLSRAAYAAYVIQIIPLGIIGKTLMPHMTQFPVLNFILVAIPGVVMTFLLAHYLCKLPVLNRIF